MATRELRAEGSPSEKRRSGSVPDTALALAVLHHMAGRPGITFNAFAHMLDRFAEHAAIVEFIPGSDVHIRRWPVARQPWYTLDGLIAAMSPYFPRVEVLPSSPAPRQMALFRRKAATRASSRT